IAVLPGPVRGRGTLAERLLYRRSAEPAGDPGGGVPDERGRRRRQALLPARHRLCLPAHHNKILRAFLHSKGVDDKDIQEVYTPFGHSDYQTIVADIKKFAAGGKTAVVSTVNGDSNVPFYKELANQGLEATEVPVWPSP
ncbi:periplasmic binding domain protein, partial [Pseudomonas aeruginosa]